MSNTLLANEVSSELWNCLVEQLAIICQMNAKLIIYQVYCAGETISCLVNGPLKVGSTLSFGMYQLNEINLNLC